MKYFWEAINIFQGIRIRRLLGHFEHTEQSEGSEGGDAEAVGPGRVVDPPLLEQGAQDHEAVEPEQLEL